MRQLKLKSAFFYQVAYLDPQHIVSMDTIDRHYAWRVWDLSKDETPPELTPGQVTVGRRIFYPNGRQFLRTHGYWPEGELLPVLKEADIHQQLRLETQSRWSVAAFGPDCATILYREAGPIGAGGAYATHFHIRQ